MVGRGTRGFGRGGARGIGGGVETEICTTEQSKLGGVWEVLRASIHSPPGRVNRDGGATGRECGPEWVGPWRLLCASAAPCWHREAIVAR